MVNELRAQYASDIKTGNLHQEINLDSLEVFMRESLAVDALAEKARKKYRVWSINPETLSDPEVLRSVSNLVMSTHVAAIKSIKQLNDAVLEFNDIAEETFIKLYELSRGDIFTRAGLVRLAMVHVLNKKVSLQILRLVPFNGPIQDALLKLIHPEFWAGHKSNEPLLDQMTSREIIAGMLFASTLDTSKPPDHQGTVKRESKGKKARARRRK